jgi:alkaline phosphatase
VTLRSSTRSQSSAVHPAGVAYSRVVPHRRTRPERVVLLVAAVLLVIASTPALASAEPKTVLVAGDIAQGIPSSGEELTARLIDRHTGLVMTAGDNAYDDGTLAEFKAYYEPTWGRFLARTRPTPGNHDYNTPGAKGYFDYFRWRAGPDRRGFYALKVGDWRIYALDSEACEREVGCGPGSPQYTWLKRKLAQHEARCSMAVFHTPLFSSGLHGNEPRVLPLVRLLYRSGAELIINGHEHDYERMAPARPSGQIDRKKGVQQIIVGTGGAPLRAKGRNTVAHSRVFSDDAWGVLRLRLRQGSYTWKFLPVEGETFTDQGERRCHGKP